MIDQDRMNHFLSSYKAVFFENWQKEKYKWEAVKWFQDHWKIDADDFGKMFYEATEKTGNLLASGAGDLPRSLVVDYMAKYEPETTRTMFRNLFNDATNLLDRVRNFRSLSIQVRDRNYSDKKDFYLKTNAISTFLWLKFPEKYYIYRFTRSRIASDELHSNFVIKKGELESMIEGYKLNEEIRNALIADKELVSLFHRSLNPNCYEDPTLVTLTVDYVNFIYKFVEAKKEQEKAHNEQVAQQHLQQQDELFQENTPDFEETASETPVEQEEQEQIVAETPTLIEYSKEKFLNDVYLEDNEYDRLVSLLRLKTNVILQGPPGVGKTFAAKRLAYSMMGEVDDSRIEMVQFHQSYSYEDFVMGYRPSEDRNGNFKVMEGIFYNFCKKAEADINREYFFIIDEINRGNLSRIFGELLMLIENDHRGESICLTYRRTEKFSVPKNLYIIGMMNTADRSLALIDHALRRRFGFFEMWPAFGTDSHHESSRFNEYLDGLNCPKLNQLIHVVKDMNQKISETIGEGFVIGHSYFCGRTKDSPMTDNLLYSIINYEIVPAIQEYWFDNKTEFIKWKKRLQSVLIEETNIISDEIGGESIQ